VGFGRRAGDGDRTRAACESRSDVKKPAFEPTKKPHLLPKNGIFVQYLANILNYLKKIQKNG